MIPRCKVSIEENAPVIATKPTNNQVMVNGVMIKTRQQFFG
jgi:hypothetical protein